MARVLIVGCGCRGRSLAGELLAAGHAVRGTTRRPDRAVAIRDAGAEPVLADPDRVGTLVSALAGVTVVVHLLGSAHGSEAELAALHGPRLQALLEKAVDTTVRGVVYEASGSVPDAVLATGAALARSARDTWQIPLAVLDADPGEHEAWLAASLRAIDGLL